MKNKSSKDSGDTCLYDRYSILKILIVEFVLILVLNLIGLVFNVSCNSLNTIMGLIFLYSCLGACICEFRYILSKDI